METASTDVDAVRRDLRSRGYSAVVVSGGCMEPSLKDGQWVLARLVAHPRRGDMALLDCGGVLEIHRLGFHVGPWWLHKGDSSPRWGVARRTEILGVVAAG